MDGDTQGVFPCLREERIKAYRKELPSLHSRLTAYALYKPLTDTAMLMFYVLIIMLFVVAVLDSAEKRSNNQAKEDYDTTRNQESD